ncbi:hypothetical protein AGMMS49593_08570 [Endomicrobiia bacterium]|nr:hypothetical protein AGMMS49593_08570 [Endomicrobiia bacterium]
MKLYDKCEIKPKKTRTYLQKGFMILTFYIRVAINLKINIYIILLLSPKLNPKPETNE